MTRALIDRLRRPVHQRLHRPLDRPLARMRLAGTRGMTTAEYAVGTLAACAFAAVLIAVVRSGPIRDALVRIITAALSIAA